MMMIRMMMMKKISREMTLVSRVKKKMTMMKTKKR